MKHFLLLAVLTLLLVTPLFAADDEPPEPGFNEATFKGLEMRSIGPAFMSGRIADIAIDPTKQNTWYVAVGSGGIWKTINAGITWEAVFDNEGSYSVGSLATPTMFLPISWTSPFTVASRIFARAFETPDFSFSASINGTR